MALRPAGFTDTLNVPGTVPDVGETESQLPALEAVAVNAEPAVPLTVTVCGEGADEPAANENVRVVGVAVTEAAATVKLIGTVTCDPIRHMPLARGTAGITTSVRPAPNGMFGSVAVATKKSVEVAIAAVNVKLAMPDAFVVTVMACGNWPISSPVAFGVNK